MPPAPGAELAIVYAGAVAPEALDAHAALLEDVPGAGLLAVTSYDRLHADWTRARQAPSGASVPGPSHPERLLAALDRTAALVTVIDGHPAALSWLGAVAGHRSTRWESSASASRAISRTCTAPIASTPTPSSTRRPRGIERRVRTG